MHATHSILYTILERLRFYLDEATLDAKYDNDFLLRHVIMPEFVTVYSRLARNFDNPPIIRHPIPWVAGQEYYVLPPNVMELIRVAELSDEGRVKQEWIPRGEFDRRGPGWALEGNMLVWRPIPQTTQDLDIWYIPSGDFLMHYSDDGETFDTTGDGLVDTLDLEGEPVALGALDIRTNGYVGGTLRIIRPDDKNLIEERMIETYSPDAAGGPRLTVRRPFTSAISPSTPSAGVKYEIVPLYAQALASAVAASGAVSLGTAKSISEKKMKFIMVEYRKHLKTVGDQLANMQARIYKSWQKSTVDNTSGQLWFLPTT
jgi:hypothetical protein